MEFKEKLIDEELKIKRIICDYGHIEIMEDAQFSPATNSVSEFYVHDEFRGKGFGNIILKEAMKRYEDLGAQVSSLASLKVFYNNGYRPLNKSNVEFEEVVNLFKENGGSLFMDDKRIPKQDLKNKKRPRP